MSHEELIIRRKFEIPIRTRIYQTSGIFVAGIGILWGVTSLPWANEYILEPLSLFTTWMVTGLLQLFGERVFQDGLFVRTNILNLEITPTLTGIYQIVILSVGIFAWSGNVRKSLRGIGIGISILVGANLLRIMCIYYCTLTTPDWLPFIQGVFWEGVMVLLVPLFWMYWAKRVSSNPEERIS
jgi:exosortase/archaeosortase family protein